MDLLQLHNIVCVLEIISYTTLLKIISSVFNRSIFVSDGLNIIWAINVFLTRLDTSIAQNYQLIPHHEYCILDSYGFHTDPNRGCAPSGHAGWAKIKSLSHTVLSRWWWRQCSYQRRLLRMVRFLMVWKGSRWVSDLWEWCGLSEDIPPLQRKRLVIPNERCTSDLQQQQQQHLSLFTRLAIHLFPSILTRRHGHRPSAHPFSLPLKDKKNIVQISSPSTSPLDAFLSPIDVLLSDMYRCYLCFMLCY